MLNVTKITRDEALDAVQAGEFEPSVTMSAANTAIILTQGWCPQWSAMEEWIETLDKNLDLDIHILVYDTEDFFEEFLRFKEDVLGNTHVPYVRYYHSGKLISQTNYVSKANFLQILKLE